MTTIMSLYAQGRFPFDRLVRYFDLADVQTALEQSYAGEVIKPVLRMP
jgi:aryl-alcohol dehydrogenase